MIPAGNHRAKAIDAILSETSTGKEQVVVNFELLDLPGESITWYGYFTDKTTETTLKGLRAAGFKGLDINDMSSLRESPNEVSLVVEHERNEKDGSIRARVRWVNTWGGPTLQPLAPEKARAFATKIRAELAKFDRTATEPRNNGAPPRNQPKRSGGVLPPEPPPVTDDIPF